MSRPPKAHEKVLDAFETILRLDGERAATLDAVAEAAGVSKGGLLYHFRSKDELVAGLLERLSTLVDADIAEMAAAPEGPVAHYLRTSTMGDEPLDHAIVAVARLAQGGDDAARDAIGTIRARWADRVRAEVPDQASLDLVMLVGDGLYFNNVLGAGMSDLVPPGQGFDALLALIRKVTTSTGLIGR